MASENHIARLLDAKFQAHKFNPKFLKAIHIGKFANAIIWHYSDEKFNILIKDFSHCIAPIRTIYGRISIHREFSTITRCIKINATPKKCHLLSKYAICYEFIEGATLNSLQKKNQKLPVSFFQKMEENIAEMHALGIVHLDLRNMSNILCDNELNPHFIDFGSALKLKYIPPFLRQILRDTDKSAICKAWQRTGEVPLPPEKQKFLDEFNRIRKFWILRGYPLHHLYKRLSNRK